MKLGADPGRCGWAPDRDRQLPAVWDDFILGLERHPPSHGAVKLQVTGPLTLALALEPAGAGLTGVAAMAGEVSLWLAAAVSDQVRALAELGLAALVMIDEPGLMAAHRAGATPAVWDALRAAAPAWGLHVCGEVPWRLVDAAEPDVLDASLLSGGCGTGGVTVDDEYEVARGLRAAAGVLRGDPLPACAGARNVRGWCHPDESVSRWSYF
jgi:hypothetical protein